MHSYGVSYPVYLAGQAEKRPEVIPASAGRTGRFVYIKVA